MPSLDSQWMAAKAAYDRLVMLHGPRSQRTREAHARMTNLAHRILRRDARRRAA